MVRTVSPELLYQRLGNPEPFALIDTRPPDNFEEWHIPGAVNYPYDPDENEIQNDLRDQFGIDPSHPVITVCAKGISSYAFASELKDGGYADVAVVQDGMEGWSRLYELAAVPTVATSLEIFQLQRVAKGCLGYVIGSPAAKEAVVVDPTRHIDEFERVARDDDMQITHVVDTHIHADHISGGRELASSVDATYHLPATAADRNIAYDFAPLNRNEVLSVGEVELKALATPGHTTEQMSILVGGEAILTADSVFTDSVGRTELQFGEAEAATGARQLYDSIHGSILVHPDHVTVLPGHFDPEDKPTSKNLGSPVSTSIRRLRRELNILQADRDTFVERLTANLPEKPPNYERMIAVNQGEQQLDETEATELEMGPNRCAADAG